MAVKFQVAFDCADAEGLGRFWASALGYVEQPPPEGFSSWEELLAQMGIPEEEWGTKFAIVDPDGDEPRIFFQQVPEGKAVKNRVHLDVNATTPGAEPGERKSQVSAVVERLVAEGATRSEEFTEAIGYWVIMTDPEGNEFCVH